MEWLALAARRSAFLPLYSLARSVRIATVQETELGAWSLSCNYWRGTRSGLPREGDGRAMVSSISRL